MKRSLNLLPFLILIVILGTRFVFGLSEKLHFEYDEAVVYEISKLPVSSLIDTLQAEPHPPGFYLLLKTLAPFGKNNLKLVLTFIGTLLSLISLVIAQKNNLLEKYRFSLGISLFVASSGFMEILTNLKQDVISFPLLLIGFSLTLLIILKKKYSISKLIFVHLIVLTLLFFGYIAYLEGLVLLLILTLYFKDRNLTRALFGFQVLTLFFYLIFYGVTQVIINLQKFAWLGEFENSFIKSSSNFLLGLLPFGIWTDLVLLIFFVFVINGFFNISKIERKEVGFGVAGLSLITLLLAYLTRSFVRERYVAFLFFLASILWGWGVSFTDKYKSKLERPGFIFIIVFFIVNTSLSLTRQVRQNRKMAELNGVLIAESKEVRTGFIVENPTLALVHVREYALSGNLIPINVFSPQAFARIDREFLLSEGASIDLSHEDVIMRLRKEKVRKYLYLMSIRSEKTTYDPKRSIFSVLSKYCSEKIAMFPDSVTILYKFEECKF